MAEPGGPGGFREPSAAALPRAGAFRLRAFHLPLGWGWIRACLDEEVEQRRLFPWLAVAFGLGIVLFFVADEPTLWAPLAGLGLAVGAAWRLRHRFVGFTVVLAVAAVFAGFAAAAIRTAGVAAPRLTRTLIAPLAGFVEAIDERETGGRLVIRVVALGELAAADRPRLVRVGLRGDQKVAAGDYIVAQARLLPPPEPARPGGYDFARDAYFRGIGAVGSILGKLRVADPPVPRDLSLTLAAAVDRARNALTRRIAEAIGGQAGAVTAALVTGKRGLIDESTNDVLRAAGIYHIVSISGLHMVLAAGTVFWIVRALLALSPALALFWPVKKIAAVVAMLGAFGYCIFSGADVATERSLIMTLVMLGAILVDRPVLSIRNLAVSALIVLTREPEALLGPSFQMSYGAVAALIAFAGFLTRRTGRDPPMGMVDRAWRWLVVTVVGLVGTTLVASLATSPFGAYHFQTANPFGLLGNALTLPLVSIVVMPAAVVGMIAYPFGLDRPVWWLAGLAVERVLAISAWIHDFAGSMLVVPAFGAGALACFAVALVLSTVPISRLRWLAVLPGLSALGLAAAPERFDVYVDRDGAGAAVRGRDGRLVALGKPSDFVLAQWLKADGDGRSTGDATVRAGPRCDPLGCVIEAGGGRFVALVTGRAGFEEDCRRATVVISRLAAPKDCAAAAVVDRTALAIGGATALRLPPTGPPERVSTRRPGDARPWLSRPPEAVAARTPPSPAYAKPPAKAVPSPDDPPDPAEADGDGTDQ